MLGRGRGRKEKEEENRYGEAREEEKGVET